MTNPHSTQASNAAARIAIAAGDRDAIETLTYSPHVSPAVRRALVAAAK